MVVWKFSFAFCLFPSKTRIPKGYALKLQFAKSGVKCLEYTKKIPDTSASVCHKPVDLCISGCFFLTEAVWRRSEQPSSHPVSGCHESSGNPTPGIGLYRFLSPPDVSKSFLLAGAEIRPLLPVVVITLESFDVHVFWRVCMENLGYVASLVCLGCSKVTLTTIDDEAVELESCDKTFGFQVLNWLKPTYSNMHGTCKETSQKGISTK